MKVRRRTISKQGVGKPHVIFPMIAMESAPVFVTRERILNSHSLRKSPAKYGAHTQRRISLYHGSNESAVVVPDSIKFLLSCEPDNYRLSLSWEGAGCFFAGSVFATCSRIASKTEGRLSVVCSNRARVLSAHSALRLMEDIRAPSTLKAPLNTLAIFPFSFASVSAGFP